MRKLLEILFLIDQKTKKNLFRNLFSSIAMVFRPYFEVTDFHVNVKTKRNNSFTRTGI